MCSVRAKPVVHLMKFHLLQWEVAKVKFLMNSNMTLTVLNLYQKTDPKVQPNFKGQGHYSKVKGLIKVTHDATHLHPLANVHNKHQLSAPCSFRDIARTRFYRLTSLRQGQSSNQGQTLMLHTYTTKQCPYQVSSSYTIWFPRYSPDKIL